MTTKAAHYIEQLDAARCDGNWAAVPELVRKVRKHAPQRECLALTAETECAISNLTSSGRQSISATAKDLDVINVVPKLLSSIDDDRTNKEDVYQAQTCVGWLHWVVAEYKQAVSRLPKGLGEKNAATGEINSVSEWTSICVLKAAYLRANCLAREGKRIEALASYNAALPSLDRLWSGQPIHKQLRYWSELFLTEYCTLSSEGSRQNELPPGDRESIACYRCWARYWEAMGQSVAGGVGFKGSSNSVPRRTIWREYYSSLSQVVQNDLHFAPGNLGKASSDTPARTQLATELKRVESAYERLLLDETEFPRADEHREEVEAFVAQVMKNWEILCGRGWSEKDIGVGGRAALSRGVLSTLYNAATKTYHSTAILRSLFNVHVSLAEFDLAFKAFDSYLDIVKKVKARVEKTGILEPSLDDNGVILETLSNAIMALCLYGRQPAVEKARHLGAELEDWLSKLPQSKTIENGTSAPDSDAVNQTSKNVAPQTLSLAWQAIGLSHAYWSRVTPDASSRTEIQAKAVRSLRRSLASEFGRPKDVRSIFAVALLLAERKELSPAIDLVRSALMVPKDQQGERRHVYGPYWQERSLIPVWHLLALLLSARQDYAMAVRACDGALEQFRDPTVLFGKQEESFRSDASGESAVKEAHETGLVDELDDSEKESILEVKMTQLTLIELQEGPNAAVNASYELLALFTRLFGVVAMPPASKAGSSLEPPKTAATARGFRGSIFGGKSDRSQPPTRQSSVATVSEQKSTLPSRPATTATSSPVIQVTEDARRPMTRQDSSARSESGRRNSLKKRNRSASRDRAGSAGSASQKAATDGDTFFTPTPDGSQGELSPTKGPTGRGAGFAREKTVSSLKSILSSNSKSTQQSELVVESAYATPHLLPLVQFPKDTEKMRHVTILIKVWTMIAGFYRRAEMLDECKAAVSEAQKLVQSLETDASKDSSAPSPLNGVAWGETKTVDELWGDVYSELGYLSLARNQPYDARADFESALTHYPNHTLATVGLSNILLDVHNETLLPPATLAASPASGIDAEGLPLQAQPLGWGPSAAETKRALKASSEAAAVASQGDDDLPEAYKASSLPLVDRLAARDRAFTLLSGLTRLGSAWDSAEAWFALARAHEESGQPDKAKEVLWWCVELEEATGVREWRSVGGGGYIV